jgi:hypothetical protein
VSSLREYVSQKVRKISVVESDETFFLESDKGKKFISHREPRKRGGVATQRGISKEQICVVVAQDRNGQVISQMAGKGRVKSTDIEQVLGNYIDTSALLCSDTATNYKSFRKIRDYGTKLSICEKVFM